MTVEPVSYLASLEWLRNHSGVPAEPLDEGERKLQRKDIQYLTSHFASSQLLHFYLFGRLSRIWPSGDRLYRRLDHLALRVPLAWKLAGSVLVVGKR